ncbi:helix-turn-helix transcriptional regulator [Pandoraea bronchicola]|uniref:Transcriptional regulator n=1 Tax=Pandoraea bronchicola TaxID=2508287 RepID=A0A5E5BVN7_9BURK|nr:AlpA family transcriptional regulator [Pandoraea bronchicola]VVE89879.1 transcriptional regulator [Pandoraea bronchicola]
MNTSTNSTTNVLRLNRLKEKTGISRSTVYNKINPKSKYYDDAFPKPIRLGPGSVGWLEAEVNAWLASRVLAARS